ncbi:HET-domain-containing protein [Lentithecium fluviatile CBS 122367]|uniref:HET-domain-containing protein n=1 Tax=Lentithecium fluviatile CBS 122367 TaxID=1168545 RepID=A0A6G1IDM9_9PLEO|nr:HET-domain-containing protein [Lentithecium fluviatile CBS 122367]
MVYFSNFWQKAFRFKFLPFQLDRWLFSLPTGWKISFGIWARYTVDGPGLPPSKFPGGEYMYSPLEYGEIRLLKILPGDTEDVIMTELVTTELTNPLLYEALSYVWGPWHERRSLRVNGQAVEVHAGLFDAIHTLRSSTSERLIWADAICIDQSNFLERNHQVSIMGQIYESAKSVTVYLGQSNERTAEGMQVLQLFANANVTPEDPPWSHMSIEDTEESIADIIHRPWFTRIWTVQEATLARHTTLICGQHQVSWSVDLQTMQSIVFRIKAAAISPHFTSTSNYTSTLDWTPLLNILETQMRQAARRKGRVLRRNQLDLAFDFRHRQSMDPRDKYFAIFSIIENDAGGRLNFGPDYNLCLEEVHRRFTAEVQRISKIEGIQTIEAAW